MVGLEELCSGNWSPCGLPDLLDQLGCNVAQLALSISCRRVEQVMGKWEGAQRFPRKIVALICYLISNDRSRPRLVEAPSQPDIANLPAPTEALNLYRRRGRMKPDRLEHYAKLCRVERVMRPYMESNL